MMVNPLSPQSDQNQFFLFDFNTFKPREKVLRTNKMITEEKMFWKLPYSFFVEMYGDQSIEFLCGFRGLKE